MKPSSKDSVQYEFPDGTGMSLWACSDRNVSPWSFFWAEFEIRKAPKSWYRVFRAKKTPGDWLPMKTADEVFKQTGFDDDPDILSDPDPDGAQVGAAEKLPKGKYVFQAKISIKGKEIEFGGVTFSVK
jgi:hypothetical protein